MLDQPAHPDPRFNVADWPGNLEAPGMAGVRLRLADALGTLPEDVRLELVRAMASPERNIWARSMFAAIGLARSAGLEPVRFTPSGGLVLRAADGAEIGLVVLGYPAERFPAGEPADLARLGSALDATFGDRQYVLYLRKAVPAGFDAAPVARAVHLWLSAIQRGEWQGQHAIYEDNGIALELTLTGAFREEAQSGRLFTVGPISSLERLAALDQRLVDETHRFHEEAGEMPLVFGLGADGPWRMPRGYVQQLLYGTAEEIRTEHASSEHPQARVYEAAFRPNGRSLFSDPVCRDVTALWWIEPDGTDILGFRTRTYENPWTVHPPLAVDALRFRVVGSRPVDRGTGDVVVLSWIHAR